MRLEELGLRVSNSASQVVEGAAIVVVVIVVMMVVHDLILINTGDDVVAMMSAKSVLLEMFKLATRGGCFRLLLKLHRVLTIGPR